MWVQMFREVADESPELASAWSNLGNAQLSLGKPEEALSNFTRAVTLAPEAPVTIRIVYPACRFALTHSLTVWVD